ncbi:MAG: hypothetical protein ACR2QO_02290 [Acidimicrobiales bacterium]
MSPTAEARLQDAIEETARLTEGRDRTGTGHDDADDVEGTIATDDAIGFDPRPLLRALDRHDAQVVIMGQVAGILHGSSELTGDLDLLWSGNAGEAVRMCAGFDEAGATLIDNDDRPVPCTPRSFELAKVQFETAHASGDCCTPALPWGGLDIAGFIDRAESAEIDGMQVRYLSCPDLIVMRRAVGRPKDLRRAMELEQLCREQS